MTDFQDYTSKKLTSMQKKGRPAGTGSAHDFGLDRPHMGPVRQKSAEDIFAAQRALATMALDKDEPEEWLADVLSALGITRRVMWTRLLK